MLEQERRDEMTQVSDDLDPASDITATHLDVISVKHQFYLILVALAVLICLSGNIIIYSHVCPLDMWPPPSAKRRAGYALSFNYYWDHTTLYSTSLVSLTCAKVYSSSDS